MQKLPDVIGGGTATFKQETITGKHHLLADERTTIFLPKGTSA
jgi:hypothetical protein